MADRAHRAAAPAGAPAAPAAPDVPVVVLGGYLGAGKTTTVNHLLRHAAGRRLAVLVNDFGELAIDADLIEGQTEDGVLALAGGCVCCSFGGDLLTALRGVARRQPPPDAVLIECSGVGLPGAVARIARLAAEVRVQAVVVLADAETLADRLDDRFVGDVVRQQLAEADLVVLNKVDLAPGPAWQSLTTRLTAIGIAAPVVPCEHGRLPPEVVFDVQTLADPRASLPVRSAQAAALRRPPAVASHRFESTVRRFEHAVDVSALAATLTAPGSRVVRAKGVLTDRDGQRRVLQVVGRRAEVTPATRPPGPSDGHLLVISVR